MSYDLHLSSMLDTGHAASAADGSAAARAMLMATLDEDDVNAENNEDVLGSSQGAREAREAAAAAAMRDLSLVASTEQKGEEEEKEEQDFGLERDEMEDWVEEEPDPTGPIEPSAVMALRDSYSLADMQGIVGRQFFPGGLPGQAECHTPALAGLVNFLSMKDAVETNPYALALLRIRSTPHIVARWVCSSPVFSARLYAP